MYYREFGQGAPVVILHGLFGFSDNWQTIAKGLADHRLVITPDLRNHGRSPHLPTHTYPEMADDLKTFLEEHWIFSTDLVGHSMGGKVAMQFALHHSDMVNKLVVVDIAPGEASDNHSDIFQSLLDLDLSKITTRQEADTFLAARIPDYGTRQFLLKNIGRDANGRFTWKMNLPVLWQEYPAIVAAVDGEPFDKPALFIRGSRSGYIKDADFSLIKTLFPQAEIKTIEDAGHWVHADKPAELLETLQAFLG
jgi:esterase